jgi:hypothetical protein
VTFADQLVARLEPWINDELQAFLQALASMFAQTELYAFDWETDEDAGEGWTRLFDPDLCPAEALPYLAQVIGETLPVGLEEAAAREWIKDNPNARRGTPESVFLATQRQLTGNRLVSMQERYGGVVDKVAIRTNTLETPNPAGTMQDILSVLPADTVLEYLVVSGATWDDAKAGYANWTAAKAKTWGEVMSALTGWNQFQRPPA